MENLKIKVNSEAESKEVQDLFIKLGCDKTFGYMTGVMFIGMVGGGMAFFPTLHSYMVSEAKEITLPELRDMVVLKRNNIGDATHVGKDLGIPYFVTSGGDVKVWDKKGWVIACATLDNLKPIGGKEMKAKEYLKKIGNNEYMLMDGAGYSGQDNWIEIPEGAEMLIQGGSRYFVKYEDGIYKQFYFESKHVENNKWVGTLKDLGLYRKDIVWQRETLNDQVASAKAARQSDKVLEEILNGVLPEFNIKNDNVNQPIHYCSHPSGIECIEITRHHDFSIGNAIKYLWRAGLKDSNDEIQDLEKAIWYIQDKINQLKNK